MKPTPSQNNLIKNAKNQYFNSKKIKKYPKCPALGLRLYKLADCDDKNITVISIFIYFITGKLHLQGNHHIESSTGDRTIYRRGP